VLWRKLKVCTLACGRMQVCGRCCECPRMRVWGCAGVCGGCKLCESVEYRERVSLFRLHRRWNCTNAKQNNKHAQPFLVRHTHIRSCMLLGIVPAGQASQVSASVAAILSEKVPVPHRWQFSSATLPVAPRKDPATQGHCVCPTSSMYVTAGHTVHSSPNMVYSQDTWLHAKYQNVRTSTRLPYLPWRHPFIRSMAKQFAPAAPAGLVLGTKPARYLSTPPCQKKSSKEPC